MATSFSGGGSESTRRELSTTDKLLVNLSLAAASRVHPFCDLRSRAIIDHFFTKAIPCTHKPDDPDKQCTVDEDASSEESSNVALPQDIETERSADSCIDSSPPPLTIFQLYRGDQF
jgi:hypothetical protein